MCTPHDDSAKCAVSDLAIILVLSSYACCSVPGIPCHVALITFDDHFQLIGSATAF